MKWSDGRIFSQGGHVKLMCSCGNVFDLFGAGFGYSGVVGSDLDMFACVQFDQPGAEQHRRDGNQPRLRTEGPAGDKFRAGRCVQKQAESIKPAHLKTEYISLKEVPADMEADGKP